MLDVYATFAERDLAMPVIKGPKTASERFPGAVDTFAIEAMMQDRKALQAGTSHFLGQNFSKASGIKFHTRDEKQEFAWTTSWGVSTRLIGGLVMTHADDDGLVIPPRLAPSHVVILPVLRGEETRAKVMEYVDAVASELRAGAYAGRPIEVEVDRRDIRGGDKAWEWIKKGAPLRIEIGPRDVDGNVVMVARRDRGTKDKTTVSRADLVSHVVAALEDMQKGLFEKALANRSAHAKRIDSKAEFDAFFTPKSEDKPEIHGGFAISHWCGNPACEKAIKERLKVTIRVVPMFGIAGFGDAESLRDAGSCVECGAASSQRVVFAKSY